MLRWILLLVAMVAFGFAFRTDSPGMLAAMLVAGFIALVAGFVGFVSARVDGVAQGQSSREVELLMTSRKRGAPQGDSGTSGFMAATATSDGHERDLDFSGGDAGGDAGSDAGGGDGGGGGD